MDQDLNVLIDTLDQDIKYAKTISPESDEYKNEVEHIERTSFEYLREIALQTENVKYEIEQLRMQVESVRQGVDLNKALIQINEEEIKQFTYERRKLNIG